MSFSDWSALTLASMIESLFAPVPGPPALGCPAQQQDRELLAQ